MSNTINSAINKVIHVKPAINRKRILRYAEKFPGVDTIVNEFFMRGPIKSQFPDQHPIDEAVTHAIAVYQSFVDEGLVRLAGKLSERSSGKPIRITHNPPFHVSYGCSRAVLLIRKKPFAIQHGTALWRTTLWRR